ncbi:hypothetical protein HMPREF0653_02040 [Prevotella disiens JCM 6334 = ATCC 29426]|uniref:Protein of uncharacterized function (DUF3408) n=2 Tax=Prevotella disiens TaxID=28130 RepID=A0A379EFK6_9BACT|nr:DUF3408 domain-containing protein [Prevotella disiens]ERJ75061.1 hypothetical protein HMPREF0653_02040 [Prevotella disiens JCM 6334 = ATCC 29426]SUB97432.1 Protein of uncharacterised function (DUF3408) [Prevotella disiens]
MIAMDENRRQRLEQAIKDMENYGVKPHKPEDLPFYDQPSEFELEMERKSFAPVEAEKESGFENRKTDKVEALHRASRTKNKDREELALFQEKYLQPIRLSHRKAVYVSEETQRRLSFIARKIGEQGASVSGYAEQVLREHLDQCKEEIEKWRKL